MSMPPSPRGLLNNEERKLLLEGRAERARDLHDTKAAHRYGLGAEQARTAVEEGDTTLNRGPELPHFTGEILVHKVEHDAEQVPVHTDHPDHSAGHPTAA